jgi:hypothetical protein
MKTAFIIGIVSLLMVVWAALHDIIKGEENLTNEYIALSICVILLPVLIVSFVRKLYGVQN